MSNQRKQQFISRLCKNLRSWPQNTRQIVCHKNWKLDSFDKHDYNWSKSKSFTVCKPNEFAQRRFENSRIDYLLLNTPSKSFKAGRLEMQEIFCRLNHEKPRRIYTCIHNSEGMITQITHELFKVEIDYELGDWDVVGEVSKVKGRKT